MINEMNFYLSPAGYCSPSEQYAHVIESDYTPEFLHPTSAQYSNTGIRCCATGTSTNWTGSKPTTLSGKQWRTTISNSLWSSRAEHGTSSTRQENCLLPFGSWGLSISILSTILSLLLQGTWISLSLSILLHLNDLWSDVYRMLYLSFFLSHNLDYQNCTFHDFTRMTNKLVLNLSYNFFVESIYTIKHKKRKKRIGEVQICTVTSISLKFADGEHH